MSGDFNKARQLVSIIQIVTFVTKAACFDVYICPFKDQIR